MPIYEYICNPCNKRVNLFFRSYDEANRNTAVCPDCDNSDLRRLISVSSISSGKNCTSEQKKSSNNPYLLAQNMRSSMRKSGKDYGNEFNEVVHRLEKGENPNSIEKSLRKRSGEGKHMCPDGHVH
jgi:putative FmdB family regulatory protein